MNRTEVLKELTPLMRVQTRDVDHNAGTRIRQDRERLIFYPGQKGHAVTMAPEGVKGVAKFAGLPPEISSWLLPETFARVVTELLARKEHYTLMVKDGQCTDIVPYGAHRNLNVDRVLDAIERVSPDGLTYQRALIMSNYSAQIELVGVEEVAVQAEDLIRAGAIIGFSPIGTVSPAVSSYVLRLACTNGARTNDVLREFHYGDDDGGINAWLRKSVREAFRAVGPIATQWRRLSEEQIPAADRAMILTQMIRDAKLGPAAAAAIQARALENPPQTSYDMLQLVTWASSHAIERPAEIHRAQLTAARFAAAETHNRVCPVYHRAQ